MRGESFTFTKAYTLFFKKYILFLWSYWFLNRKLDYNFLTFIHLIILIDFMYTNIHIQLIHYFYTTLSEKIYFKAIELEFYSSPNWCGFNWNIKTCKMTFTKSITSNDPFHVAEVSIKCERLQQFPKIWYKVKRSMTYTYRFQFVTKILFFSAPFTCNYSLWITSIASVF